MKITLENMARPDLFVKVIREIAAKVTYEKELFAQCRELIERGATAPGVEIALEGDCVVVRSEDREVAREFLEHDREDWFFEDGPWAKAVEELSESLSNALPVAA
jgi:hypothetical protein